MVIVLVKIKHYDSLFQKSQITARKFGYLIGINGNIGAGKTSLASGLSHIYQIQIIEKINEKMKEVTRLFDFIDFNEVKEIIIMNQELDYDHITKILIESLDLKDHPVFDYLTTKTVKQYFKEYIIAFCALLRNNFVMSKTRFYSFITATMNLHYDVSQQEIHQTIKYSIFDYLVEIQDESSEDNSKNDWRIRANTGSKEYRAKYRHIHRQTNRFIVIRQEATDEVKSERLLLQTNLKVINSQRIIPNQFVYTLIKKIIRFRYFGQMFVKFTIPFLFKWLKSLFKLSYQEYLEQRYDTPSVLRIRDKSLYLIDQFALYNSFLIFNLENYKHSDDVYKVSVAPEEIKLFIPTRVCYTYPEFEHDHLQDELLKKSNYRSKEMNFFKKNPIKKKGVNRNVTI